MNAIADADLGQSQRRSLSSMTATPVRGSMLAIRQESVRIVTPLGLLDAQLVKILRIDQGLLPPRQHLNVPVARTRLHTSPSPRGMNNAPGISNPASHVVLRAPLPERISRHTPPDVELHSIGEMLTDYDGNLYELRDQQLHMLGQLVIDSRGRLFEVCKHSATKNTANKPLTSPLGVQPMPGKSSSDHALLNLLKRLARSVTRLFQPSVSEM